MEIKQRTVFAPHPIFTGDHIGSPLRVSNQLLLIGEGCARPIECGNEITILHHIRCHLLLNPPNTFGGPHPLGKEGFTGQAFAGG